MTMLACLVTNSGQSVGLVSNANGELLWKSESPELTRDAELFVPLNHIPESGGNPIAWAIRMLAKYIPGETAVMGDEIPPDPFYNAEPDDTTPPDQTAKYLGSIRGRYAAIVKDKKESYFGNCPRDAQGHCKPKGTGEESGKEKPKGGRKKKPAVAAPPAESFDHPKPNGHKDWEKIAAQYSEDDAKAIAEGVLRFVNKEDFKEHIEWQAQHYQGLSKKIEKRPELLRMRAAMEQFTFEMAQLRANNRRVDAPMTGASAGHNVSKEDEKIAWNVIAGIADKALKKNAAKSKVLTPQEDWKKNGVKSKAFKEWFGDWEKGEGSKAVNRQGAPDKSKGYSFATNEEGEPVIVYHGTTHDFREFDPSKAFIENHLGKGFYFSGSDFDATKNYAGEGNDLKQRIGQRADDLGSELENAIYDFQDDLDGGREDELTSALAEIKWVPESMAEEILESYRENTLRLRNFSDDIRDVAKDQLGGSSPHTVKAYLNLRNPVVLDGSKGTYFGIDYPTIIEDGEEVPDYGNPTGPGADLMQAMREVLESGKFTKEDMPLEEEDIQGIIDTAIWNDPDGVSAESMIRKLAESQSAAAYLNIRDYNTGESSQAMGEFLNETFRKLGYDGVVYADASNWFLGMDIPKGTRHYIAFDPHQIKSADNEGTFDPKTADIYKFFADALADGRGAVKAFLQAGGGLPDIGKAMAAIAKLKGESYFGECPRDELGHCKPKGTGESSSSESLDADNKDSGNAVITAGGVGKIPKVGFLKITDPSEFKKALGKSTRAENHSEHSDEELKEDDLFLSEDKKTGFLLTKDGDFGNLFNNGGPQGAGQAALIAGIKAGARTLDCYDKFLPTLYTKFGYVAKAALPFNDEYAPPGWDFEKNGRPNIIFMAYEGGDRESIEERIGTFPAYNPNGIARVDSYDAGKRATSSQGTVTRSLGKSGRGMGREESDDAGKRGGVHRQPVNRLKSALWKKYFIAKEGPVPPAPSAKPKPLEQEHISEARGKPCKPGQSAARTGCIPAKDDESQQQPAAQTQEPTATRGQSMRDAPIRKEPTTPIPEGKTEHNPDPNADSSGNGISDSARVGVPGDSVPPPPPIARLPNLTEDERAVESRFADAFEADVDGFVNTYLTALKERKVGDAENVFATDDAKFLSGDYNPKDATPEESKDAKSRYNTMVHQTANAIAKKAFLKYLDDTVANMPADKKTVLVTSGGVASGKGYAISKVNQVNSIAQQVGAVWDAAGEQNATENPWVLAECKKRGIRPIFVFVNADPIQSWSSPGGSVVERAGKKGRMVDARPFAESYVIGAKNFHAFHQANKDKGEAEFFIIDNPRGGTTQELPEVPEAIRNANVEELYGKAVKSLQDCEACPAAVKRGGTAGLRIWPNFKDEGWGE